MAMYAAIKRHCEPLYAVTSWSKAELVADTENDNRMNKAKGKDVKPWLGMRVCACVSVSASVREPASV